MGWCRQCCALMRKNRLIKFRLWGSTLAEVLLPVLIMFIMVGLRAAVSKTDTSADLHSVAPTYFPNIATLNGLSGPFANTSSGFTVYNPVTGPNFWDTELLKLFWQTGERNHNRGLLGVQHIHFVPDVEDPVKIKVRDDMAAAFIAKFPDLAPLTQTRFSNEKQMEDYVKGSDYATSALNAAIAIGVVIDHVPGGSWNYVLRGNFTQSDNTATTLDVTKSTVNTLHTDYDYQDQQTLWKWGHHFMQDFVENYVLQQEGAASGATLKRSYWYQSFPTPPYVTDLFPDYVSDILGLFFTIIYIWPVTRLVKGIVEEKQLRIKEGMRMMGLPDSVLFCSWFGTYFIIFFLTSILITLVTAGSVYSKSNKFYIFIFFFFFALTTFSFCWLVSVFFSRAQVATTFSALIFLGIFFPYFAVTGGSSSAAAKGGACILSPVCFGLGAVTIQRLEADSTGVNRDTASVKVDDWSYNNTIGLFVLDFFLYLILALYFQEVIPSEWGTTQKFYFCFDPKYWCPPKVEQKPNPNRSVMVHLQENGGTELAQVPHHELKEQEGLVQNGKRNKDYYFEPVAENIRADLGVSIQNMRKTFDADGGEVAAVKGLNLDLYSGQILALLGHNGAGKTTTINMLSGMLPISSGDAYVYGSSVRNNIAGVRKILGVCPQHNILWDLLTVKEHLEIFAAIKDVPTNTTETQIDEMIAQVGLTEKVNDKSAALSGGMQRKLSVGIALLGDSKIVFLDEPTSGMDPYSRRATWDLLKKKKEGRVIILTTHFMDEADQLGDRIAIMAKGDVKCCGSSLFLKGRYGVGYTLTLTKTAKFKPEEVMNLINSKIPDVSQLSNIAAEISFRLPFQSSGHFADVFDQFDGRQEELGIDSYGISVTTLEEVFLRVGHEDDASPEHVVAQKKMLQEKQRTLSHSANLPLEAPHDIGDSSPELVVASFNPGSVASPSPGAESHEKAAAPSNVHLNSTSSKDGTGLQTISVSPRPEQAATSPENGSAEPEKKKLIRTHSSRFARLRIPGEEVNMFFPHFKALFLKRFINAKRDRKVWTWTLVYPFLILLVGIGLLTLTNKSTFKQLEFSAGNLLQGTNNYVPVVTNTAGINLFGSSFRVTDPPTQFLSPSDFSGATFQPPTTSDVGSIQNMNQFLLNTIYPAPSQQYSRYNAFFSDFQSDPSVSNGYIDNFVVFFNSSCQWASSYGFNIYNNQILSKIGANPGVSINLSIHPFPQTLNQKTLLNSVTAVITAIGFAFMPANFIAYAVREEETKVKHQQLISGVSALSYWTANYAWDFLNYMVMGTLCLLIFKIWSIDQLVGSNTGATYLAIILYGLSVIPFNYMMSFLFTESTSAQNTMLLFYIFAGALVLIAMIVLSIISTTKNAAYHIRFVVRCIPSYAFGEAIANIIVRDSSTAFGEAKDLWDMDITGWPMIYMTIEIFVYFGFVLLREKVKATPALMAKIFGNPDVPAANIPDDDADVINERQRLQSGQGNDMIKVMGLRKVYAGRLGGKNKIAVQDLWMGIPEGQCFGFLGINGAGKTTTLKMLTGDVLPNTGTATLNGLDILTHQNDVRRLLGYCPQFDSLIGELTGREHLALFARIKGVEESIIPDYCEHLITKLGLQEGIADNPCKGYSGGNKRKLCVGIALIGNPPIVFLDEPSTGMDPGSRRFMWDLIANTMKGRSVILTTHSMEECEALCHSVGIMVGGRLRCLGTTSHLKSVYGHGYQLDVNLAAEKVDAFKAFMTQTWETVKLIEEHGHNLKFRIPKIVNEQKTSIGTVFRLLETVKVQYQVIDYAVSDTTLEQIFINFARQQEEETGHVAGIV